MNFYSSIKSIFVLRKYVQISLVSFLATTKQLYEWFSSSVCPFVCPSVCNTFSIMLPSSYHHEIFRSDSINRNDVHAKGQGQRSKVKVTEVKTQRCSLRTITPVWIQVWQWNDVHCLIWHREGVLLFLKVILQTSRSHGTKKSPIVTRMWRFRTVTQI